MKASTSTSALGAVVAIDLLGACFSVEGFDVSESQVCESIGGTATEGLCDHDRFAEVLQAQEPVVGPGVALEETRVVVAQMFGTAHPRMFRSDDLKAAAGNRPNQSRKVRGRPAGAVEEEDGRVGGIPVLLVEELPALDLDEVLAVDGFQQGVEAEARGETLAHPGLSPTR